jgi:hypothetical protein
MRASARRGIRAAVLLAFASSFAVLWVAAPTPAEAAMPWTTSDSPKPPSSAAKPAPSLTEALGSVGDLSHELKLIDRRLVGIEHTLTPIQKAVVGIDTSLGPVGDLAKPDGLRAALEPIVDRAFERARGLILLATGCVAGLIVLHALMRRWTARRDAGGT